MVMAISYLFSVSADDSRLGCACTDHATGGVSASIQRMANSQRILFFQPRFFLFPDFAVLEVSLRFVFGFECAALRIDLMFSPASFCVS